MSYTNRPNFLRTVLSIDAATCVATGSLMTVGSGLLAQMTRIPIDFLFTAGLSLFPIAAFIGFVAMRKALWPVGVWLVILGNAGWVAGSVCVGGTISLNAVGNLFVAFQAAAVTVLAACEYIGLHNTHVQIVLAGARR